MKEIRYNKTLIVMLLIAIISSMAFSVEARVKKHRSSTRQATSTSIPEGYSQALENAAKSGDAEAQTYLGTCYKQGNGVQQSDENALYWYGMAAAKGNSYAQAYAAMMYLQGEGTETDEEKGYQLALSSARQFNAYGEYILGVCYLYGLGVEEDVREAWNWLNKSSSLGINHAKDELNKILEDEDLAFEATYDYKEWITEYSAWNKAKSLNIAIAYQKYIELYPNGEHIEAAKDAYIDATINKTERSEHYALPQSQKIKEGYGTESTDTEINETGYTIEIIYSGPIKKTIIIEDGQSETFVLKNGTYKVVAKVLNGKRVANYYGTLNFDGGEYSGRYYIVHR